MAVSQPLSRLPEAVYRGITLRGLRKLCALTQQLFEDGKFSKPIRNGENVLEPVDKFMDLTTEHLVYG